MFSLWSGKRCKGKVLGLKVKDETYFRSMEEEGHARMRFSFSYFRKYQTVLSQGTSSISSVVTVILWRW